ncbi:hypothetical protein BX600DRAFT_548883 [Xylariales sp. PMI_506]|nr:hypothetical protein BX600DRAFT_548883 [Xylariales sp. PMI_506]
MPPKPRSYDIAELRARIYVDLPEDLGPIQPLLEQYSNIAPDEVGQHILDVREKLWSIKPYGCIGKLSFLNLSFTSDPRYKSALARLTEPDSTATFLDMGCCVGQVLRQLAFDGVDSSRLYGSDLEPRFIELGYELFRDRDSFKGTFVAGDVFNSPTDADADPLSALDGEITFIHAGSFFHLFTWDDQVAAAKRLIRFLKQDDPDVMIFGRQVGCEYPGTKIGTRGHERYLHNAKSWQKLWDEVGKQTKTRWQTEVIVVPGSGDTVSMGLSESTEGVSRTRFAVFKAKDR